MEEVKDKLLLHFKDLHFNESKHIYTVDNQILPSVSGLIKRYVEPFPKDAARKKANKLGITEAEMKAQWKAISDEACDRGHRVHEFGEYYPFDRSLRPDNSEGLEYQQKLAVMRFWEDIPEHIVPVVMELRMYHKEFGYAGTADIILYCRRTDTLIIADYKTNKDLFKNFAGKTMLSPFGHLLDNPLNHYQLQLSYYQILLEQTGYKVSGRKLVWLQDNGTYKMYDLEDFTSTLKEELKMAS